MLKKAKSLSEKRIPFFFLGLLAVAAIGYADYLTGDEFSLELFYFFPVIFVNWRCGRNAGIVFSAATTAVWIAADVWTGMYFSHPLLYVWDGIVRFGVLSVVSYLVIQWHNILEREKGLARKDFLTGISNPRAFYESARDEVERSRRFGRPLTLVYFDCDNFKLVNDQFGHQAGDRLLTTVAETLSKCVRSFDIVARLGGDEFAALLPETDIRSAVGMVDRIRARLDEAMKKHQWGVTFSIGVASFTAPPCSVDEMVGKADGLMYAVKLNGKNTVKHEIFGDPAPEIGLESASL